MVVFQTRPGIHDTELREPETATPADLEQAVEWRPATQARGPCNTWGHFLKTLMGRDTRGTHSPSLTPALPQWASFPSISCRISSFSSQNQQPRFTHLSLSKGVKTILLGTEEVIPQIRSGEASFRSGLALSPESCDIFLP